MKKILISVLLVLSVTLQAQILKNKKYDLATAGSTISVNLASDVQMLFVSGTRTLSAPFSMVVTGTQVDGKTILVFWDGTSLTTGGNLVNLLGANLTDKQATSKLIILSVYKTNIWETRVVNDAKTVNWVDKGDLKSTAFDGTTIELDGTNGVQLKAGGITNTKVNAAAAIAYSKLALTGSVLNADLAGSVAWNKMVPLTAGYIPYTDGSGFMVASATTSTQLGYLVGVTSAIQTQINTKATSGSIVNADVNASAAIAYSKLSLGTSIVNADIATACSLAWAKMYPLTASRVPYINSSGVVAASSVTDTELGYLSGATSNVQTQITAARSSRTYTETTSTPLVLNSSATDSYLIKPSTTAIVVTLPSAADFAKNRTIEFTRLGTVSDSSITIIAAGSESIEGVNGADVANYILPKAQAGGAGVQFISNGVDSWKFLKKW